MQFSDYLKIYREYTKEMPRKRIRVAFLSMFTIKGLKEVLTVKAWKEGIAIDCKEGAYRQVIQETVQMGTKTDTQESDITFILWDINSFLGEYIFYAYNYSVTERRNFIQSKLDEFVKYIDLMEENISGVKVINNFEIPDYSSLGIMETKQEFGFIESIEFLNQEIRRYCVQKSSIYIFDYAGFVRKYGRQNLTDNKMYYLGDMKISMDGLIPLADLYLSYIRALAGKSKKCLVLDLDNTLWGGIIGEDGIDKIKLGLEYEGKAYWEFQKYIKGLQACGVILAVNSKNNYDDVMEVFQNHKNMVLRENDFASIRINWNDKVSNMKEISEELNIGLDSFVFIDDDKVNCEMMEKFLPMVKTIHLNGNPVTYVNLIQSLTHFNTLSYTQEDKNKNEQYRTQKLRNQLKHNTAGIDDFLAGLDIKTEFEDMNPSNIARISQLTMKTNQFNLTTRRYTEADLEKLSAKGYKIKCINVKDCFGDNGICGVLIYKSTEDKIIIDTMLLSCRVMGRKIEDCYFELLKKEAIANQIFVLEGEYIQTAKNKPVANLYREKGFLCIRNETDKQIWRKEQSL